MREKDWRLEMKSSNRFRIEHWKIITVFLIVYDMAAISAAYFLGLLIRFDFRYSKIDPFYLRAFYDFLPIYLVFCLVLFWAMRLYKSLWRFASADELSRIGLTSIISCIFHVAGITYMYRRMPVSYHVIGTLLQFNSDVSAYLLAEFRFQRMLSEIFKILADTAGVDLDMLTQA